MQKKYVTVRLESEKAGSTRVAGVWHINESDRGPGTLPLVERPARCECTTRDVLVTVDESMTVAVVDDDMTYPNGAFCIDSKLAYDHIHSVDALHMVADAARAAVAPEAYIKWCQQQELAADDTPTDEYPIDPHAGSGDVDRLPLDTALDKINYKQRTYPFSHEERG